MRKRIISVVLILCFCICTLGNYSVAKADEGQTAAEVVADISVGWSLGNSLACCDATTVKDNKGTTYYETLWGNPVTTQEMIHMVKVAGFNAIRVPITYYNHIDEQGIIDPAWLGRIAEVVQYGLNENMYVIINIHHDTGKGTNKYIQSNLANIEIYKNNLTSIWAQVALYFKDYDSRLIFESMNETLDMQAQNPWYGNDSSWQAMNVLNQSFVDVVRATGGKNSTRNLIVNTYGAQTTSGPLNSFRVPSDTVSNHLIVGVHTYVTSEKDIRSLMGTLNSKFISQGYPVIVGEFGTPYWSDIKYRIASAIHFINYGNMYGIKSFWWDDGGNYKLLDRKSMSWRYPQIVNGMMQAAALVR